MISSERAAPTTVPAIGKLPLSVCIVAHNEADVLPAAIASVSDWAAEVVVLDCESTDDSAAVAAAAGAVVYRHPNGLPDANKNACFDHAVSEWVLNLDPDEVIPPALVAEIAATLAGTPVHEGYLIPRRNHYFGAPLMHGGMWPNKQLRLFRRGRGRFPGVGIHERVMIDGTIGELTQSFDHHPYPTFADWLRRFDFYTALGARELAERGTPITARSIRHYMITRPLRRWLERLFLKRGIRDGVPGVFAAGADFATNIGSFVRYWIAQRNGTAP